MPVTYVKWHRYSIILCPFATNAAKMTVVLNFFCPAWLRVIAVKIKNKIIVLVGVSFALSACGSIPAAPNTAKASPHEEAIEATEVKAATDESGLGTIAYNENTRAQQCKKQRRTGSHLYQTTCDDPDSGSQPVRFGGWHDLGRYAMSGSVRPEN